MEWKLQCEDVLYRLSRSEGKTASLESGPKIHKPFFYSSWWIKVSDNPTGSHVEGRLWKDCPACVFNCQKSVTFGSTCMETAIVMLSDDNTVIFFVAEVAQDESSDIYYGFPRTQGKVFQSDFYLSVFNRFWKNSSIRRCPEGFTDIRRSRDGFFFTSWRSQQRFVQLNRSVSESNRFFCNLLPQFLHGDDGNEDVRFPSRRLVCLLGLFRCCFQRITSWQVFSESLSKIILDLQFRHSLAF